MSLRGLTLVVAAGDPARFRTALGLACAQAALGGRVRLFIDAAAVPLLADPPVDLTAAAFDLGVTLIACQTGLAAAGLRADALDPRIEMGGLTSLLADLGDDRLAIA